MKKILEIYLLFCCLFLVGCSGPIKNRTSIKKGPETLTCSNFTESTIDFTTDMIYRFLNDNIFSLEVRYTYDLSQYNEDQRKTFADSKMCDTESFKTKLGMRNCTEELAGAEYIVTGYADKLLEQATGTLQEIKESYEDEGWTCSIR